MICLERASLRDTPWLMDGKPYSAYALTMGKRLRVQSMEDKSERQKLIEVLEECLQVADRLGLSMAGIHICHAIDLLVEQQASCEESDESQEAEGDI